jgi:hypothetical protein
MPRGAAEWAFGLADISFPGGSRGGVAYRPRCPAYAIRQIAAGGGPSSIWPPSRDVNEHLIFGG